MAGAGGIEPPLKVLETLVIPFYYAPMWGNYIRILFEFCGFFVFGVGSALFAEFLHNDFVCRVGFIFACNVVLVFALRTN